MIFQIVWKRIINKIVKMNEKKIKYVINLLEKIGSIYTSVLIIKIMQLKKKWIKTFKYTIKVHSIQQEK